MPVSGRVVSCVVVGLWGPTAGRAGRLLTIRGAADGRGRGQRV